MGHSKKLLLNWPHHDKRWRGLVLGVFRLFDACWFRGLHFVPLLSRSNTCILACSGHLANLVGLRLVKPGSSRSPPPFGCPRKWRAAAVGQTRILLGLSSQAHPCAFAHGSHHLLGGYHAMNLV